MGLIHGEMTAHQGQNPAKHNCFKFKAIGISQHATRDLIGVSRGVCAANKTDGPELQRLGDRGNRMGAH
jgi:hypothetical protein